MTKKGDKKTIRAWAMYDWANSAYSLTITSAIFPAFYVGSTLIKDSQGEIIQDLVKDEYGIASNSLYSWSISLGFLIVALIAPLLSGIADYSDSKKKFMQFFCYLGAIACASLYFFEWQPGELHLFWIGIIAVTVACVGWSGGNIFYNAYLPEIAEPKDHDRISAMGFAMGYIGSVLLLLWNLHMVMNPEFYGWGVEEGQTKAIQIACLSVGIWWALFAQYTFKHLPTSTGEAKAVTANLSNGYKELAKVFHDIKGQVAINRYLMAFFIYNLGVQTTMYMAANFAATEIKSIDEAGNVTPFATENLVITILLIQLVAIPGAYLFSFMSKRFGNIRTLIIAVSCWVLIVYGAYTVEYETAFYLLAAAVGLVMGGIQALSRSTYSKLLPKTKDTASYFSFYNVLYYLGIVFGTLGFGIVENLTGDIRNSILVIGSAFVIGLLLLLRVPKMPKAALQS